jgi:outer membrane receptor protein involved in Fe transport
VGSTFDSSVPTGDLTLPSCNRVDANLTWSATPSLRVAMAVENLFDEDYE